MKFNINNFLEISNLLGSIGGIFASSYLFVNSMNDEYYLIALISFLLFYLSIWWFTNTMDIIRDLKVKRGKN